MGERTEKCAQSNVRGAAGRLIRVGFGPNHHAGAGGRPILQYRRLLGSAAKKSEAGMENDGLCAGFKSRQVQQIADQVLQIVSLLVDNAEKLPRFGGVEGRGPARWRLNRFAKLELRNIHRSPVQLTQHKQNVL
jgi:hypothetical protein